MSLALLVDRDPDTRRMYAEYLRHLGFAIEEAEDGREALAKAISCRPRVIVSETRLPGMSGFELCRLIRQDPLTRTIPVIIVTGDGLATDAKLAEAAGADLVLLKPCLPEQLGTEIHRVLGASTEVADAGSATSGKSPWKRSVVSGAAIRRLAMSRAHERRDTTDPPRTPPDLFCPTCDRPMRYVHSHIGGVSERHSEQWDYFECPACRGVFEYRQRTRKLRACQTDVPRVDQKES